MSSTQNSDDTTPATEQPEDAGTEQQAPPDAEIGEAGDGEQPEQEPAPGPGNDGGETPNEGEGQQSGPIKVEVEMMLYEAGMVANSLSSKSLGSQLADKLFAAEQEAEEAGNSRFVFAFSPFEAGMALGSMGRVVDDSLDELKERLTQSLVEIMQQLNIDPIGGGQGGAVGGGL